MKVFKFGGASINSVERIQNVATIIDGYKDEQLVIIVSAMGKTTNALEKVAEAFYAGRKDEALQLFEVIKQNHITTCKYLLVQNFNQTLDELVNFFTEVEWLLYDKPVRNFDYYYDQIVCVGELMSSLIVSAYLNEKGLINQWLDVRDIIRTDDNFRDAAIDWNITSENISKTDLSKSEGIYITQGFIGSTDENESTTLGREGSDFTAAIFANLLNAESLTIWKDVEGVMSADPKEFPEAVFIPELSFTEIIEMAFYGAQVIHPKTIKPLQNKQITLYVKCFLNPAAAGTVISNKTVKDLPPIVVIKQNQVQLILKTQDFSFVGEKPMSNLYQLFAKLKTRPNLIQTGAISVQLCLDERSGRIDQLAAEASSAFDVQLEKNLTLLTIRHCTNELLHKMTEGKDILLQQKTKETVQVIYR